MKQLEACSKGDWLLVCLLVACLREVGLKCRMYLVDHGQGVAGVQRGHRNSRILFPHIYKNQ